MMLLRRPVVYFCQRPITVTGQAEVYKTWSEERTVVVRYDVGSTHVHATHALYRPKGF